MSAKDKVSSSSLLLVVWVFGAQSREESSVFQLIAVPPAANVAERSGTPTDFRLFFPCLNSGLRSKGWFPQVSKARVSGDGFHSTFPTLPPRLVGLNVLQDLPLPLVVSLCTSDQGGTRRTGPSRSILFSVIISCRGSFSGRVIFSLAKCDGPFTQMQSFLLWKLGL